VKLCDVDSGDELEYQLVFAEEVDAAAGLVSINAPIGQALLNKTPGDEVVVQTPRGKKTYEVMELSTLHDRMPAAEESPGD
jgi:transcription elongation factor GreA